MLKLAASGCDMTNKERSGAIRRRDGEARANGAGGLNGCCVRSQADVARLLGVSRQAVYQAERMAILKIRTVLGPLWAEMKREWE